MIFSFLISVLIKSIFAILSIFPQPTVSIGIAEYPQSFLPHSVQTDGEKIVSELTFRKLFKYENGELKNDLVDSWKTNDDKTEYTIKLKKDQKWQDGTPITSNDVLYTLTLYENIRDSVEIEKLSNLEVLLRISNPNGILPSVLNIGVEPAHLSSQSPVNPIGSTSYRIARIIREQDRIEGVVLLSPLENKTYNRVFIRFYENENEIITAYKLKEIDSFYTNSDLKLEGIERVPIHFEGRYYTLIFNTEKEKLTTPEIRNVLSNSLDVDALLLQNFYVNTIKAQGPISLSKYTKESAKISKYDKNINLSPNQRNVLSSLSILLPNTTEGRQIENFLNEYWGNNLKIKLSFEYFETDEIIEKARDGSFDVLFIGMEVTPDPDRYDFWHSTQKTKLNFAKFEDLRADRALEEGRSSLDFGKRKEHYDIFQDVFETKTPGVFLYHPGAYLYYTSYKPIPIPEKIYYPSDIVKNF